MCDNNSSGQKKCSAKEGSSNRCKHGKLKSTGPSGANRRDSKRNSKEESNLNSKPCMSAPENNSSSSQSHDIGLQKIGSFRKERIGMGKQLLSSNIRRGKKE
ncbi:hypothetical protein LSTR_LSTR014837 [Laodelphax striatellus]|uniref:Uncharacterized protein n=1 Tax=Laodelphax striatellus TaxID=195883 RepID=A0A482WZU8_LAOST|nr:hypothetical protein LSTR_LSTR014837 [Laodelphax striatellus]